MEPASWALLEAARKIDGADYILALQLLQRSARTLAERFDGYDVIISALMSEPPPPIGSFEPSPENPLQGFEHASRFVHLLPIANVTGQPAMSLPLFLNTAGLPIGVHLMGRFGDEATLFRLASQLEVAQPWAHRKPPH